MKISSKLGALILIATTLFSCQKAEIETVQKSSDATTDLAVFGKDNPGSCATTIVSLIAGQHINAGIVSVINDADFIYVTYKVAKGYTLKQTHFAFAFFLAIFAFHEKKNYHSN